MAFNALKSVEELQAAGVPEIQAKAQIRILQEIVESDLATKRDIEELQLATKRDIEELKLATKRDLKELELRLTIKLGSIVVVVIGLLVALSRLNVL